MTRGGQERTPKQRPERSEGRGGDGAQQGRAPQQEPAGILKMSPEPRTVEAWGEERAVHAGESDFMGSRKGGRWRARNRKCRLFPSVSAPTLALPVHQTRSPLSLSYQSSLMAQTVLPLPSDVSPQGPILHSHLSPKVQRLHAVWRLQLPCLPCRLGHRSPSEEPRWQCRQGWPLPRAEAPSWVTHHLEPCIIAATALRQPPLQLPQGSPYP